MTAARSLDGILRRGLTLSLVCLLGLMAWRAEAGTACVKPGEWLRMVDGKPVANAVLLRQLSERRVVLLGEHHTNVDHHRWQLQVLAGLYALNPKLVIGFEMFPQEVQPALDRWVAGELSEKEFLAQTHWRSGWRFDSALYMPLFHFARLNHIPMIAINVNPALVQEVRSKGWAATAPAARQGITDPAPASREYLEMLAGSFVAHRPGHAQNEAPAEFEGEQKLAFQRFVEGQLLWDRAMAEALAAAAKRKDAPLVVGVMGTGHMVYDFGVPHQLADLGVADTASLIPWDDQISCEELVPGFAHAVFGIEGGAAEEVEKPRLGVLLEAGEDGVKVAKLMARSVADACGLKEGDRIVAMAGAPVAGVDEVIEKVQAMLPGAWLPLSVQRGEQRLDLVAKFPAKP